jgi:hypothetical protein
MSVRSGQMGDDGKFSPSFTQHAAFIHNRPYSSTASQYANPPAVNHLRVPTSSVLPNRLVASQYQTIE